MKEWIVKAILGLLAKLVEDYITDEMLAEWEAKAKEMAYEKLKDLAASTDWTEIDDALVEKLGKVWGVIE